jgi:hypothetical protein
MVRGENAGEATNEGSFHVAVYIFVTQAPDDVLDYRKPANATEGLIVPTKPA